MTYLRGLLASIRFAVVAAGQNFTRNLAVSMAGVFTMGLIMLLVGGTLLLTHTVDAILNQQEVQADDIHIYLQDSLSMRTIADYELRFGQDPRVNGVSFTTKDQAVVAGQQRGLVLQPAIAILGSNPLPASIDLHVRNLSDLTQMNNVAKSLPIVDTSSGSATDYNPDVIPRLQTVITWTVWIGGVLSLVLAVISLVIIMNTIRTAVYIRRTEIEIMKLVGAGDWFVRWPFILEGVFGGLLAAAFGATVVALAYRFVLQQANTQAFLGVRFDGPYLTAMVVVLVVFGAALGGFGSFLGVRRFLHV
jgi:cell division transport system permease protein